MLCATLSVDAQKLGKLAETYTVSLSSRDYSTEVEISVKDIKVNTKLQRTYYWFKAQEIHQSRGDYEGKLLHGNYTTFYRSKNLKEKGVFDKGLKNGEWKSWYPDGEIKEVSHWKEGQKHGTMATYDEEGNLLTLITYRKGKLHGPAKEFSNGVETSHIDYKKGDVVIPKVKPETADFEEITPDVPEAPEDPEAQPEKKSWFKNLFKKKDKTDDPEEEVVPEGEEPKRRRKKKDNDPETDG